MRAPRAVSSPCLKAATISARYPARWPRMSAHSCGSERRDMAETNADVEGLTFERAIEELETIVKRLEEGKVPLEESVAIYERGEALKRRCDELLRAAEARIEKFTRAAAGTPTEPEPLDVN